MKLLSIYKARVIEVIDGDTFKGEVDLGFDVRITRHFRVFGIDTPDNRDYTNLKIQEGFSKTKLIVVA